LAFNIEALQRVFKSKFDFFPQTFVIPFQLEEFKTYYEANKKKKITYIVKPEGGCQGKGIYLSKKNLLFNTQDKCIV
jgi:tubulin polyglutamylase TTLL6/13